jgi:hypothetical protein
MFIHPKDGDSALLDGQLGSDEFDSLEEDNYSFCESVAPDKALSENEIISSMNKYCRCLKVKEKETHAYVGMTALNFHQLCCCLNTDDYTPYIGCITVGPNKIKTFKDLKEEMLTRNCNAAIVLATLRESRYGKHYYSIWRGYDRSNKVGDSCWNHFDPIYGITEYADEDESVRESKIFEHQQRSFFVFNLKFLLKV